MADRALRVDRETERSKDGISAAADGLSRFIASIYQSLFNASLLKFAFFFFTTKEKVFLEIVF